MTRLPFESAETLVYDPVASNRNATRASLHSLGFRKVELAPSLEFLTDYLRNFAPDLLLCEVAGAENDICSLIQDVRQGRVGNNPFLVVMATTWRRDGSVVGQVVNSGADDLVVRPFSTSALSDRIHVLIERRKHFVVTSDYIGPDRRRVPGRDGVSGAEVPNSLKIRTMNALSLDDANCRIEKALEQAKARLNREKLRRDAVTLYVQSRLLAQKTAGTRDFFDLLPRAESLAAEIQRRVSGLAEEEEANSLCDSVTDSVRALLAVKTMPNCGVDFPPIVYRITKASLAVGHLLAAGDSALSELVSIEAIQARNSPRPSLSSQAA